MILHTVTFKLKHNIGSNEESAFLKKANSLRNISTVLNFQCYKQVSKKNHFQYALSMNFENQEDYDTYCDHPDHVAFVQKTWLPEVEDFIELDYVTLDI